MTDTRASSDAIAPTVDPDAFARRYLAHASSQLPGSDEAELVVLAEEALEFGAVRPEGSSLVRVWQLAADTIANEEPEELDEW